MPEELMIRLGAAVFGLAIFFLWVLSRYRKCPSDKILVVYGKVGADKDGNPRSCICIHGGAKFIVPVLQSYAYLDLTPIEIELNVIAWSKSEDKINVQANFKVGISTELEVTINAAERLLGLPVSEIQNLADDIIVGQLREVISEMETREATNINLSTSDILNNVESELNRIGLKIISTRIVDIVAEKAIT